MVPPALALLLVGVFIALGCVLFWPRSGLVPLLLRALRTGERECIEDALKHLYDCEYHGSLASIQSLAGSLEMSTARVARLIARLEALGLVRTEEAGLRLTTEGRSYALRIIRIHRLWETYLADRTGFEEAEWHVEADRREHRTSGAELNLIAQATGNPRFDPHGDPIPTEAGEVPTHRGKPLSDLPPGSVAMIVHVEDEPEVIYAQLRAQNIRVRQRVTILDKSPERIWIEVDGEEQAMAPIVAGNVWVTPLPKGTPTKPGDRLSSLKLGESSRVIGISPACQGLQRRRLLDLGLVPGTQVAAVLESPTGDPTGYRIRGAVMALRREQADLVYVQGKSNREGAS
jgi:DtxR family Mn-dependent transcriptional regulator